MKITCCFNKKSTHSPRTFHTLFFCFCIFHALFSRTLWGPMLDSFHAHVLFTHICFHALHGSPHQQCHKEPDHLESGVWIWDLGSGVTSGVWGLESGVWDHIWNLRSGITSGSTALDWSASPPTALESHLESGVCIWSLVSQTIWEQPWICQQAPPQHLESRVWDHIWKHSPGLGQPPKHKKGLWIWICCLWGCLTNALHCKPTYTYMYISMERQVSWLLCSVLCG